MNEMAATIPLQNGTVMLSDSTLAINGYRCSEPSVVQAGLRAQEAGEQPATWLAAALRIGATALDAARADGQLVSVERALNGLSQTVSERVDSALTRVDAAVLAAVQSANDQLAAASHAAVDRLGEGVTRLFLGPEATVPAGVQRAVREVTDQALAEISRSQAAQAAYLQSTLSQDRAAVSQVLAGTVTGSIDGLRAVVDQLASTLAVQVAVEAERGHGSAEGLAYEAACIEAIGRIAHRAGDGGCEPIGTKNGIAGDRPRAGDGCVSLRSLCGSPDLKILVEAKDRARKLSLNAWVQEFEAGRRATSSQLSLGICPRPSTPNGEVLQVVDSRTIIVGWSPGEPTDILTAGYLLLRLAAVNLRDEASLDPHAVTELLRNLSAGLAPFDALQRQGAAAARAVDSFQETARSLRADLTARIAAAQESLFRS